jgi:hypothetical protein
MPNYGKYLPFYMPNCITNDPKDTVKIRKGIPYHLDKAIKNIKRHKPGSRRYKYWKNVRLRFKKCWAEININEFVTVEPMSIPTEYSLKYSIKENKL